MERRGEIAIRRPRGKGDAVAALLITAVIVMGVIFVTSLLVAK